MMDVKLQLLKLFPSINEVDLEKLSAISTYKLVQNKELILKAGDLRRKGVLILEGSIRGYILLPAGQEKNLMLRSTGIFVGDVNALFNHEPQKLNIEAIEPTHILLFKYDEFELLIKQNKSLLDLYLSILKEAILKLNYRLNSMILMTPEERYVDLINSDPYFLKSAYSKHVANYLGITPVSLSRIMKRVQSK